MKQKKILFVMVFLSTPWWSYAVPKTLKATRAVTAEQEALRVELTGREPSKQLDSDLYAELVGAYQADDEVNFKSRLQALLSRFPQSQYADNALYLAGTMAMEHKNYAEALKHFAKIKEQYPQSNKLVSAEFAKGMTYKKMNLTAHAKDTLRGLRKKYPGSPEAFRAENELKIMK